MATNQKSSLCMCHSIPCIFVSQGNQSINMNLKGKMKAAWVISYFPLYKWIDWFPERQFDRILVANTESWILIGWHKKMSTIMKCGIRYRARSLDFWKLWLGVCSTLVHCFPFNNQWFVIITTWRWLLYLLRSNLSRGRQSLSLINVKHGNINYRLLIVFCMSSTVYVIKPISATWVCAYKWCDACIAWVWAMPPVPLPPLPCPPMSEPQPDQKAAGGTAAGQPSGYCQGWGPPSYPG